MLCTIPARGGSKTLPRKNILPLGGKPVVTYSIAAALESGLFEQVYVCTDDAEIAEISRRAGATVPGLMPAELCGDLVSSHIPCTKLAADLAAQGKRHDVILVLQPTSPLRSAEDIRKAVERFSEKDDFLVSVTPVDPHYFHWAVIREESDPEHYRLFFREQYMVERPYLPLVLRPNGSIKIGRIEAVERVGHFFGPRTAVIETPEERSIHVRTRFDLDLCEFLLRSRAK